MSYCTHCGAELPEDATSCPACRRPLAAWAAGSPPPPPPRGMPPAPPSGVPPAAAPAAAPARASARRVSPAVKVGIAFGCLALLVVAVGIVAALVVPGFLAGLGGAKQARTIADLRQVGTALESYRADHLGVPAVASFEELAPILVPDHLPALPTTDGWEHPLRYECTARGGPTGCTRYRIASPGRDGEYSQAWLANYLPEAYG
ncbi:MAG TPA: zinc ribbon domain-containing protein, partial [Thermoanaerobaculia bacterium]